MTNKPVRDWVRALLLLLPIARHFLQYSNISGLAGSNGMRPFASSLHTAPARLAPVCDAARRALLDLAKPSTLKKMPINNQMVLLKALSGIACRRPAFVSDIITALVQAADSLRSSGTLSLVPFVPHLESHACAAWGGRNHLPCLRRLPSFSFIHSFIGASPVKCLTERAQPH